MDRFFENLENIVSVICKIFVFIASLMIGELQSFGVLWIPRLAIIFQFLLMAVVLITRPTGLFGEKE